jgi:competence protein ComEC
VCGLFFGRFSLIAPLCNLVAVPVGGALATPLALATAGMSALLPEDHPVVLALAWACGAVLWALDELALRASALPGAALQADPWALRLSALGCLALALRWAWALGASWGWAMPRFGRKTVLWIWAVAALGAVAPWHALGTPGQNLGMLTLWHLDVGQGDSTLIGLPDGTWVLVDGGGQSYAGQPDPGRWAVAPALRALGVRRLRAVVLTHPHPDHMGGLKYVLGRWPTDALWRADEVHGVQEVQVLETLVRRGGGVVQGPPPYAQWGGVHVRALLPLQHRQASVNDHSIVLQLTYKSRRALLMGDAERAAEANVLPYVSRADILKAGHHGSRTSSSEALLRAVRPQAALISCGAQNRFGHPHPQTLAALKRHHSAVLRTDVLGTVRLQTDGCTPWRYGAHATGWRPLPLPEAGP